MSPRFDFWTLNDLKNIIVDLCTLYVTLNGKLKPKFHILTHYPRLLLQLGPCIFFWCMRFESKHRDIKASAVSVSGSRNLLITVAKKQSLKMFHMLQSLRENPVKYGPSKEYKQGSFSTLHYSRVEINGTEYIPGMCILLDARKTEKEFGVIKTIKKLDNKVVFIIESHKELIFDENIGAFKVIRRKDNDREVKFDDLPICHPLSLVKIGDSKYLIPKYML